VNVRTCCLANIGHGIHETQTGCQERIGSMLGQLGGWNVGDDDRNTEYVVQFAKPSTYSRFVCADQYSVGVKEVGDCTSFTEEFGIGGHMDVTATNDGSQTIRGAHGYGGSRHDDGARSYNWSNLGYCGINVGKIGGAVVCLRGRNTDEDD